MGCSGYANVFDLNKFRRNWKKNKEEILENIDEVFVKKILKKNIPDDLSDMDNHDLFELLFDDDNSTVFFANKYIVDARTYNNDYNSASLELMYAADCSICNISIY